MPKNPDLDSLYEMDMTRPITEAEKAEFKERWELYNKRLKEALKAYRRQRKR